MKALFFVIGLSLSVPVFHASRNFYADSQVLEGETLELSTMTIRASETPAEPEKIVNNLVDVVALLERTCNDLASRPCADVVEPYEYSKAIAALMRGKLATITILEHPQNLLLTYKIRYRSYSDITT